MTMTAIDNYNKLKDELVSLRAITSIDIQQVEYPEGGKQNHFILNGINKTDTEVVVKYFKDNMSAVLTLIRRAKRAEVEAARGEMLAEIEKIKAANQTPTAE